MNIFEIKILCAILLWAVSIGFGIVLPYFIWKISSKRRNQYTVAEDDGSENEGYNSNEADNLIETHEGHRVTLPWTKRLAAYLKVKITDGNFSSVVYCLCGGVFLGVSLLDLIPQSRVAVTEVLEASNTNTKYPVTEFMIALGLLLVMIVENLVTAAVMSQHKSPSQRHTIQDSPSGDSSDSDSSHHGHLHIDVSDNVSSYRMYVLVGTLSLHSIFEGLAIGLQKDLNTLAQLAIAVSVHKAVLAFGVGMPLFETLGRFGQIKTACACAMIFCSASPIGCFIGAFVSSDNFDSNSAALLASAILQCLATGTFLYVTFVEVIPKEFSHHAQTHHQQRNIRSNTNHSNNIGQRIDTDDSENFQISVPTKPKRQSQLIKLLALVIGFGIASGLQFL